MSLKPNTSAVRAYIVQSYTGLLLGVRGGIEQKRKGEEGLTKEGRVGKRGQFCPLRRKFKFVIILNITDTHTNT